MTKAGEFLERCKKNMVSELANSIGQESEFSAQISYKDNERKDCFVFDDGSCIGMTITMEELYGIEKFIKFKEK